jgi:DNA (cytosine-5)-methyltransferase 1
VGKIILADLFCGTGGFSKGICSYSDSFELAFAIDVLQSAAQTTKKNHEAAYVANDDIRNMKLSEIRDTLKRCGKNKLDLIIGGPPCQGFSSIRPFRSNDDEDPRNSLFEEFAKCINFFRPKMFVLENVVGITTHANGTTLAQMQELFFQIGYNTDWRIINAANYGVPQKRERFILIGAREGGKINFPKPTHVFNGKTIGTKRKDKMIICNDFQALPAVPVMDAIDDLPAIESGKFATHYNEPRTDYQRERRGDANTLTLHDSTNHSEKMLEIIKHSGSNINSIPPHLITSGFSTCYSRLEADEPANTITVNFVHPASNKCIHPKQNRALTPREGARLQSFDDDFIFCGPRAQIVKQIGNAVPPLIGKAIASALYSELI